MHKNLSVNLSQLSNKNFERLVFQLESIFSFLLHFYSFNSRPPLKTTSTEWASCFFPLLFFFPLLNTVILRFLFYHNFQVTLCIFWKHLSLPNEVHKLKKEKKDCCVPSWVLYPGLEKKDHNDSTSLSEAWYYYSKFPFLYFFSPVSPSSFHPGMEKKNHQTCWSNIQTSFLHLVLLKMCSKAVFDSNMLSKSTE